MNIIIPGAFGFVGTNLLEKLAEDSLLLSRVDKVILVDNFQYDQRERVRKYSNNNKFLIVEGSIYDEVILKKYVKKNDCIIHLAVEPNTFESPQDTPTKSSEEYLKFLKEVEIDKFVFLSTADVYGINNSDDILETDVVKPTIMYAANKVAIEAYIQAYFSLYKFPAVILRPVTIFGPSQYPGWLIPRIITKAMRNEPIQITGDGSVKRDWIYVDDVCDLILDIVRTPRIDIFGEVYNVGTGTEATVLSTVKYILHTLNKPESLIEFIPDRPGDIPRQITSAKKARQTFGWKPKTSFQKGLTATIKAYKGKNTN